MKVSNEVGDPLGKLSAQQPMRWDNTAGIYATWDGALAGGAPARVSYKLSPTSLPVGTTLQAESYQLRVVVEAVLPDGTVLRSADTYLSSIAREPRVVT